MIQEMMKQAIYFRDRVSLLSYLPIMCPMKAINYRLLFFLFYLSFIGDKNLGSIFPEQNWNFMV